MFFDFFYFYRTIDNWTFYSCNARFSETPKLAAVVQLVLLLKDKDITLTWLNDNIVLVLLNT